MMIDLTRLPHLIISGTIDSSGAEQLLASVEAAIDSVKDDLYLDMSEARVLDSTGVRALLQCRSTAEAAGHRLRLEGAGEDAVRMLQMSGFARLFDLPQTTREPALGDRSRLQYVDWNMHESIAVSEPGMVKPLLDVAVEAAVEAGLDERSLDDVKTAVGEALTNAVSHGSPADGSGRVRLKCLSCKLAIVFELSDEGEGVDFEHVVASSQDCGGEEAIGLRLIAGAMDEVECMRTSEGSRLRLIKWIIP